MEDHLLLDDSFNDKKLDNNNDIAEANRIRSTINESTTAIRKGKYTIFATIGLLTLGSIIEVVQEPLILMDSLVGFTIFIIFYSIGLALFKKKTVAGLSICFGVYLLFNLLTMLVDPSMIFKGIPVKIILIYFYSNGIYHALQLPKKVELLKGVSLNKEDREKIENLKELSKIAYLKSAT